MNILIVCALYEPFARGGAEMSARDWARWLIGQGHDVSVLTTAPTLDDQCWDEATESGRIFRVLMPRSYTAFEASKPSNAAKLVWHFQDHFDPRNRSIATRVLDAVRPEIVNVQQLQGIGYNVLPLFAERGLPVVVALHDLSLACVRTAMFRDGRECASLCAECRFSARVKGRYLRQGGRIAMISPSRSNLDKLSGVQDLSGFRTKCVLNPNSYPEPSRRRAQRGRTALLYVGRIHVSKGVHVMLDALAPLVARGDFSLDVCGDGPDLPDLRERFAGQDWIRFHGMVPQAAVSDQMNDADLLLVPSILNDNAPGVVIQAAGVGCPVMGSDKGGIPELIIPGVSGFLVEPGNVDAWRSALVEVLDDRDRLRSMRARVLASSARFAPDALARQIFDVFEDMVAPARTA